MKTADIRTMLHHFIDFIEDKKVKATYTLFEEESEGEYSPEFKAELDRRFEEYEIDKKVVTRAEMDDRIKRVLPNPN